MDFKRMSWLPALVSMSLFLNMAMALHHAEISSLGIIQNNLTDDLADNSVEDSMVRGKCPKAASGQPIWHTTHTQMLVDIGNKLVQKSSQQALDIANTQGVALVRSLDEYQDYRGCTQCKKSKVKKDTTKTAWCSKCGDGSWLLSFDTLSLDFSNSNCSFQASRCVRGEELVVLLQQAVAALDQNLDAGEGRLYRISGINCKASALLKGVVSGVVIAGSDVTVHQLAGLVKVLLRLFGGLIPGDFASSPEWLQASTDAQRGAALSTAMSKKHRVYTQALGIMKEHLKSVLATGKQFKSSGKSLDTAEKLGLAIPSVFEEVDPKKFKKDPMKASAEIMTRGEIFKWLLETKAWPVLA